MIQSIKMAVLVTAMFMAGLSTLVPQAQVREISNSEYTQIQLVEQNTKQDMHIEEITKKQTQVDEHMRYIDQRIDDVQHDVTLWKGAVLGIGSLIGVLEILQALGFSRGFLKYKRRFELNQ